MTVAQVHPHLGDAALAAFLRGIERRGFVLAEAQCGDPVRAQAAIDGAVRAFRVEAGSTPLAGWPVLFWQRLLAQPVLCEGAKTPVDPLLARLGPGSRAALLLRLIAGLDPAHAADVLRVSPQAYQHALYRALHELHAQGVTDADLRMFRERLHQRARQLPDPAQPLPTAHAVPRRLRLSGASPRRLRAVMSVALALALIGLALSFVPRARTVGGGSLPPEQAPAARLAAAADLIASPDFDRLDDPQGARLSCDLDLYAWYAAGSEAASSPAPSSNLSESATPETSAPDAEGNPGEK